MVGSEIDIIIAGLGLLCQGFFAAAETALITADRFRIKALRRKHSWVGRVEYFFKNPEAFFTTILICEVISLVLATTFFSRFIITTVGPVGTFYSILIISLFSLIFAQIIPKGIAMKRNIEYLSKTINLIFYLSYLLMPVIAISKKITGVFLAFYPSEEFTYLLAHEITEGFRDAMNTGHLSMRADRIAQRLNTARKLKIYNVMIPLNKALTITSEDEFASILKGKIYSRIPVIENNHIKGVINVKEYFYTGKIELREPFIVDPETQILSLLRIMKESGEHLAVVVDNEKPVGIITLEDLIEELVGEIEEEL